MNSLNILFPYTIFTGNPPVINVLDLNTIFFPFRYEFICPEDCRGNINNVSRKGSEKEHETGVKETGQDFWRNDIDQGHDKPIKIKWVQDDRQVKFN